MDGEIAHDRPQLELNLGLQRIQHEGSLRSSSTGTAATTATIPIHLLPRELLGEIFLLVLPADTFASGLPESDRASLIHLCLVNKRFRTAALSTRELWSSIEWNIEDEYHWDLARAWVKRAGGVPKTLKIVTERHQNLDAGARPHSSVSCMYHTRELAQFLADFAPWKTVHFVLCDVTCVKMLTNLLVEDGEEDEDGFGDGNGGEDGSLGRWDREPSVERWQQSYRDQQHRQEYKQEYKYVKPKHKQRQRDTGTWPELSSFILEVNFFWSDTALAFILDNLPVGRVKKLGLHSPMLNECLMLVDPFHLPLHFQQTQSLVELFLDCCPSPLESFDVLETCPSLVKLGMSLGCHTLDGGSLEDTKRAIRAKPTVSLPKLEKLQLIRVPSPYVLDVMHLPALHTLDIEFDIPAVQLIDGPELKDTLGAFVDRSQCTLRTVYMENLHLIYGGRLRDVFEHLRGVVHLKMHGLRILFGDPFLSRRAGVELDATADGGEVQVQQVEEGLLPELEILEAPERYFGEAFEAFNQRRERPIVKIPL